MADIHCVSERQPVDEWLPWRVSLSDGVLHGNVRHGDTNKVGRLFKKTYQ